MYRPSANDKADLVLLAILFFFLVLFSSSVAGDRQKTEERHDQPQELADTGMLAFSRPAEIRSI